MLDWTRALGRTAEAGTVPALEDQAWSGSFEQYLLCALSHPRVLGRSVERLLDLARAGLEQDPVEPHGVVEPHGIAGTPDVVGMPGAVRGLPGDLAERLRAALEPSVLSDDALEPRLLLVEDGPRALDRWAEALQGALESSAGTAYGARFTFQWAPGPAEIPNESPTESPEGAEPAEGPEEEQPEEPEPVVAAGGLLACPFDEEPFRLIPSESRRKILTEVNESRGDERPLRVTGSVCPACSTVETQLLRRYHGDWRRMIEHVRVRRLLLSGGDRAPVLRLDCDAESWGDAEGVAARGARVVVVLQGAEAQVADVARQILDWADGAAGLDRAPPSVSQRDFVLLCDTRAVDADLRERLGARALRLGE